jgi:hypothetical protein
MLSVTRPFIRDGSVNTFKQLRLGFLCRPFHGYIARFPEDPCGGGVEYFHRDPANRRRRRKAKSQTWDSKIWSRDPRDLDPTKTALARASSIYKWQTRPLVREGAPQKQDRNCQRVINIWSWGSDGARHQDLLTDWPSVAMWLWHIHTYTHIHPSIQPSIAAANIRASTWVSWTTTSHTGKIVKNIHVYPHLNILWHEGWKSLLGNGPVNVTWQLVTVATEPTQQWRNCWNGCFICGPLQRLRNTTTK